MSDHPELSRWNDQLTSRLPCFSQSQCRTLAIWSFAAVALSYVGLSSVVVFLAELLDEKEPNLRERLKDLYREATAKAGTQRADWSPRQLTPHLFRWVAGDADRLVLALDASCLKDRLTALAISVVCQGGAVPVAWRVRGAHQKGAWNPLWKQMLAELKEVLPAETQVLVMTDRGLESPEIYRAIGEAGFHPLMRLSAGARFRPAGWVKFHPIEELALWGRYRDRGTLYKKERLEEVVLLIRHSDDPETEPWMLASDSLEVESLWYAFRWWIEDGFKDVKRGGFHWERTRLTDPQRVERYWAVLAVMMIYVLQCAASLPALATPGPRVHSLVRRGHLILLARLIKGKAVTQAPIQLLLEDIWMPPETPPPVCREKEYIAYLHHLESIGYLEYLPL
jgi:hypothetical protein